MTMVIYAQTAKELSCFMDQLHDTARIMNNKFTARIETPWGVRILTGLVPVREQGHRDATHAIANKHIKLKP